MNEPSHADSSRSSVGRRSLAAVGRATSRFSRLLGGAASLHATARFLRRQLWAWPIIAAALFGGAGWWVSASVDDAMRQQRESALVTILDAEVTSLKIWMSEQLLNAEFAAGDERLRPMVAELLDVGEAANPGRALLQAPAQEALRARLKEPIRMCGYNGFLLISPAGVVLAADRDEPVGILLGDERKAFFGKVLAGTSAVSRPFRSRLLLADDKGVLRANLPTMLTAAPIRDKDGKAIASLGLRIRPDAQFTRILRVAQFGATGETYAFDRKGMLMSESRFDDELKDIGLIADLPESQSILTVELRDPGVNMFAGDRPASKRADQPLTRMAAAATAGQDGIDVDGYRDYRGVPVVGAWAWLPNHDLGVATEMSVAEAFRPLYILRRAFWVLMTLLVLCAAGIFVAMLVLRRQQKALQNAVLHAKQLGQYTLEEKVGAGGMGTVYRARHAMLRRATAVKLLDVDNMSDAAVIRFEREVQSTSALTHPNTVAIFDYGRTPEGIFYYAMEYLDGMNLDALVTRVGPLPEARVVFLLQQMCGALAEAHAAGLIHRDVKPANVFLTCRGGMHDFVKVLDFGLVKALDGKEAQLTSANAVTGTPLYLSPEGVNHPDQVDARSDVYAIGAAGYFLLTGTPVFNGASVVEICMKHVSAIPEPPSARLGKPIQPALEALILRCLAKSPADRPADAGELLRALKACAVEPRWTASHAAAWWSAHGASETAAKTATHERAGIPTPHPTDHTVIYDRPPT